MLLIASDRSPYARKVLVAAHELDLLKEIERRNVVVSIRNLDRDQGNPNPFGQIPTLVLDDGSAVHDSLVICEYLALKAGAAWMFGPPQCRIELLTRHATAQGMLDILLRRLSERNRSGGMENDFLVAYRTKLGWGLDHLEANGGGWMQRPLEIAQIATACALAYMDFRFESDAWRDGHPALAAWYELVGARASMRDTAFQDERANP
ncbi:hypothetical protein PMI07_006461 [Rhizobium sp. CF080]|uniref:glutathione S-transferase family protein n=1 Tax=Rhizobium sp. (strain CF080) TaxID=1144310 RepID=UPI000271787F|nr:glutathione S-transferase N-terminal domain-containing protein [Rhizobium sp. CF080]EUB98147.1 hypothetical protein PMI07_006461 [Rhizobium sp. CF080]